MILLFILTGDPIRNMFLNHKTCIFNTCFMGNTGSLLKSGLYAFHATRSFKSFRGKPSSRENITYKSCASKVELIIVEITNGE